ncbi:MAG: hypothetical protein AB2A00_32945 [Myxococcota bacterium]
MLLNLPTHVKEGLRKLAEDTNRSETALAAEVLAAFVDEQRWVAEVNKGLAALDEGRRNRLEDFKKSFYEKLAARRTPK